MTDSENVDLQVTHEGPIAAGGFYKVKSFFTSHNLMQLKTMQPTNAKYFEVYNPVQGAIIAYRNYSPAKYAELDPNWGDAPLPALKQWSDVVFLSWADITTEAERRNLKFAIRSSVQNQDTLDVGKSPASSSSANEH